MPDQDFGPSPLTDPLHHAIRDPHPLALLDAASMLAVAAIPDAMAELRGQMTGLPAKRLAVPIEQFIEMLLDAGDRETDALLLVWAHMLEDAPGDRIRSEVRARRHPLPRWLHHLDEVRPTRAVLNTHIMGDGDNLFIGVETPGRSFTIVLYIDHNMGTIPKDGYTVDRPISDLVAFTARENVPGTTMTELLLEDARARLEQALENESHLLDPFESDGWPGARPLLQWMIRLMPAGGEGYPYREWSDAEMAALMKEFAASPFAAGADADTADQADTLFHFAASYGGSDPLRWSGVAAEIMLMDLIPRKVYAGAAYLKGMPDTMRRVIRFAHARREIPTEYTRDALATVDRFEPMFLERIAAPKTGTMALLEQAGILDEVLPTEEYYLQYAAEEVGGMAALNALTDEPLPDEQLDLLSMSDAAYAAATQVDAIIDRVCTEFFESLELRTAARRLLTCVAVADPLTIARGKPENTASALLFIIGHVNRAFTKGGRGERKVTIKDMASFIGAKGTPNDRAAALLQTIGFNYYDWEESHALGDAALLTSAARARLIARRDRLQEALSDDDV